MDLKTEASNTARLARAAFNLVLEKCQVMVETDESFMKYASTVIMIITNTDQLEKSETLEDIWKYSTDIYRLCLTFPSGLFDTIYHGMTYIAYLIASLAVHIDSPTFSTCEVDKS